MESTSFTLSIENTSGQAQDGMKVEILQQAFTDSFTCSGLKKDIVRKHHSSTSSGFEHKHHVLEEV